jgi:hypothetical protein
MEKQ